MELKEKILKEREEVKKDLDKISNIRTRLLTFSIISFAFAIMLLFKFNVWYIYTPFIITTLTLLWFRNKLKLKHQVIEIMYYLSFIAEHSVENGATTDEEICEFGSNKIKDFS